MKTLTLFDAFNQASFETARLRGAYAYAKDMSARRSIREKIERRERQCNGFADAIRARLAPPRSRVWRVSINGDQVCFARTNEASDYDGMYRMTMASHLRVRRVCPEHMSISPDSRQMVRFERRVTA